MVYCSTKGVDFVLDWTSILKTTLENFITLDVPILWKYFGSYVIGGLVISVVVLIIHKVHNSYLRLCGYSKREIRKKSKALNDIIELIKSFKSLVPFFIRH